MSSPDILASTKMEDKMLNMQKNITTSNLPNIVFHNPDSTTQDPLLRFQGINPPNIKIKLV